MVLDVNMRLHAATALAAAIGLIAQGAPTVFDGAAPESQGRVIVRSGEVYAALASNEGIRIEMRRHVAGGWSQSIVVRAAGASRVAMSPVLDSAGERLYFESNLRQPAIEGRDDSDIWVMQRVDGAWTAARPLGPPFDTPFNEHAPTVAGGNICFNSTRPGGLGRNDIYCGRLDGHPQHVAAVSSPAQDAGPWLAKEGDVLLLASNREGGLGGWDLYVATRDPGGWTAPRNLGAPINTAADELWPSWDEGRLYFKRVGDSLPPTIRTVRFALPR